MTVEPGLGPAAVTGLVRGAGGPDCQRANACVVASTAVICDARCPTLASSNPSKRGAGADEAVDQGLVEGAGQGAVANTAGAVYRAERCLH